MQTQALAINKYENEGERERDKQKEIKIREIDNCLPMSLTKIILLASPKSQ